MVLLDALGQRWTLRIIWELRDGPHTFRLLQSRCEAVSPTVLNTRLKTLRSLNLVETTSTGYALSQQGEALLEKLSPLNKWSEDWAKTL